MPDIAMLPELASELGVTVTELLEGRRIEAPEERAQKAEEHLTEALTAPDPFGLSDRVAYFRRKWLREHRASLVLTALAYLAALVPVAILAAPFLPAAAAVLAAAAWGFTNNRMMTYVEKRAFRK